MPYLVLGIAVLAGLFLLGRWMSTANPVVLAWFVRLLSGALIVGVGAYAAISGRFGWLIYALPFLIPLLFRWRMARTRQKNARGPSPGGSSEVSTVYFRMRLDHDSGQMQGIVLRGPHAGRNLEDLDPSALREVHALCADDQDSLRLFEAWLDRSGRRGAGGERQGQAAAPGGSMTKEQAREILGVGPDADATAIRAAHRRLMAKLHPDTGGSTFLAAQINEAKDCLLGD